MRDEILGRIWVEHHDAFSASLDAVVLAVLRRWRATLVARGLRRRSRAAR